MGAPHIISISRGHAGDLVHLQCRPTIGGLRGGGLGKVNLTT